MLPADALLPEGATALEIPSDRLASVDIFKSPNVPAVATAARRLAAVSIPDTFKLYLDCDSSDDPAEGVNYTSRFTYAYITPETAPCRAQPGPFIRRVFRTLALDLPQTFELFPSVLGHGYGDTAVIFRTPRYREVAMRRQPFVLEGATVKLMPVQTITNRAENVIMAHVALRNYPIEQRTEDIVDNCCRLGFVCEIDPACFAGPDLSTVRVVLQVQHPREIPGGDPRSAV